MLDTMAKPKKPEASRKPAATDRHKNPRESFHLPSDLMARLKHFQDSQDLRPSKSEVMRRALTKYLEERGF